MYRLYTFCIGAVAILATPMTASVAQETSPHHVTLDTILSTLRANERNYDAIRIVWEQQSVSAAEPNLSDSHSAAPEVPNQLTSHRARKRGLFKGELFRYTGLDVTADERHNQLDFAVGAERATAFFPYGSKGTHPSATIAPRGDSIGENMNCLPCVLCFRPLNSTLGALDASKAVLNPQPVIIEGRPHLSVASPSADGGIEVTCYLSATPPFAIHRCEHRISGLLAQVIDIKYSFSPGKLPVPTGWSITTLGEGERLLQSVRAVVQQCDVNANISAADCEITLPPGTTIAEKTSGEPRFYVVHQDGTWREVLDSELLKPHSVWMETRTGGATSRSQGLVVWVSIALILLAAIASGAAYVWRRSLARN